MDPYEVYLRVEKYHAIPERDYKIAKGDYFKYRNTTCYGKVVSIWSGKHICDVVEITESGGKISHEKVW